MLFQVGEKVVYPNHGVGVIENVSSRSFGALDERFYLLRLTCCSGALIITNREAALSMVRNLLECAVRARATVIVTACPLCQVNLECYQKQVNKEFGTDFNMPVMYFTQLMGLALGIPPKRLGIGSELVAVMPAIKEAQEAEPALAAK